MNERDLDLIQVEVEGYLEKLLAEYVSMWVGDRENENSVGGIQNGENLYGETGRQPVGDSEGERDQLRFAAGGEPGR
jgi:hypothetical protein